MLGVDLGKARLVDSVCVTLRVIAEVLQFVSLSDYPQHQIMALAPGMLQVQEGRRERRLVLKRSPPPLALRLRRELGEDPRQDKSTGHLV